MPQDHFEIDYGTDGMGTPEPQKPEVGQGDYAVPTLQRVEDEPNSERNMPRRQERQSEDDWSIIDGVRGRINNV